MRILPPKQIDDTTFVSSTVAANEYPYYSATTTYALGTRVVRAATRRIYESLQSGNLNQTPETSPTWWLDIGPTNRWAMFDGAVGTQTVADTSLSVTISPGAIDMLAFIETQAAQAVITLKVSGVAVYSRTVSFEKSGEAVVDLWSYLFNPVGRRTYQVVDDVPAYASGVLTVTLTHETQVRCGGLLVGRQYRVGTTQYGARPGITSYSLKDTNQFGVTTVKKRARSKRMDIAVQVPAENLDDVYQTLDALDATPVLWIGDGPFDALVVYGFYKSFDPVISDPGCSDCSLQIEGLI